MAGPARPHRRSFLILAGSSAAIAFTRPARRVHTFDQALFRRTSPHKDSTDHYLPPFDRGIVEFGFFARPLPTRNATVIPLNVNLPVLDAVILSTQEFIGGCGDDQTPTWSGKIEITDQRYLAQAKTTHHGDDDPFDVIVLYPANALARPVRIQSLNQSMLPKRVLIANVSAAVDTDGDGLADLLVNTYCAESPSSSIYGNCDYIRQDYYQRKAGVWVLLRDLRPC